MTEPVRTRADVEREVREAIAPVEQDVGERVTAALLAMAECDCASGLTHYNNPDDVGPFESCKRCDGTSINQPRVARGLDALEGR